MKTNEVKFEA